MLALAQNDQLTSLIISTWENDLPEVYSPLCPAPRSCLLFSLLIPRSLVPTLKTCKTKESYHCYSVTVNVCVDLHLLVPPSTFTVIAACCFHSASFILLFNKEFDCL